MAVSYNPTTHAAGHRAAVDGVELQGLGPGQLYTSLNPLHGEAPQQLVRALDPVTGQVVTRIISPNSVVA